MKTYLGKIGELTLKGSNIKFFENLLVSNTRLYLKGTSAKVNLRSGRMYIECEEQDGQRVEEALNSLLGITGWAEAHVVEKDIKAIQDKVTELCKEAASKGCKTFKLDSRRSDKKFPLDSYGINREAASPACEQKILGVDVHNPDVTIHIEVREKTFIYTDSNKGNRGLPVGCSGRGLLLLSGGLDSPVAGYRMMRRGMKVDCIYFHSYPYTSPEAQKKVEDLAQIISKYGINVHLNIVPFTEVQMQIKKKSPEEYATLMLRMCMMECANMLCERLHCDALITGESLGQVASQTNENMAVTESMARYPLYRPCIGLDKEEIMATAHQIGTYETSILPYEDCCVIFSPKHPVLRANVEETKKIYDGMEIVPFIQKAFEERTLKTFFCGNPVEKDSD